MNYTRIMAASLGVAALALVGCSGDSAQTDSTALKSDSALAANLAMANRDSANLTLSDTATSGQAKAPASPNTTTRPAAPRPTGTKSTPTKTTPAPAPAPAPAPRTGTIAAGTTLVLASSAKVCTNTNAIGDNITATTTEATSGTNGTTIPAGATVNMTVTNLKRSENVNDKIIMEFRVNSISFGGKTYPVDASLVQEGTDVERVRDQPASKDVQKVAVGAAAGAIAGKILGKSTKGAVIGGAAGAAAGAAVAAGTANYQGCINQGARITVRLDAPLSMTVGN